jgi:putative aldouronate transport system substrate-binding protein
MVMLVKLATGSSRKALTAILLSVLLAPLAFAGGEDEAVATGEDTVLNETGYPIVNQPLTLRAVSSKRPFHGDWDDMLVWHEYEKKTGVHIEWDLIPWGERATKKNLILASGELPDFFMSVGLTLDEVIRYGSEGMFIRLNDLIASYGPNIQAMFKRYPEVKKGITTPDGNIYHLTNVQGLYRLVPLYVNKIWMENLGLEYPDSSEDYFNILKAFKEQDANNNGDPNDELPLAGMGSRSVRALVRSISGSWGLGNKGVGTWDLYGYDMGADGEVRLLAMDPAFKELLQFFNRLWQEGLIDQEIFTTDMPGFTAKGEALTVGSFAFTNTTPVGRGQMNHYRGVIFEGPNGDKMTATRTSVLGGISTVVTNQSKYPKVVMRWLNWSYSDAAILLVHMGVEGDTFEILPNGEYVYTDKIMANPELTWDQAMSRFTPYAGTSMPSVQLLEYSKGGISHPVVVEAMEILKPYVPEETWPAFILTQEELATVKPVISDAATYIDEMVVKFITGNASFSEWDNYINTLDKMGIEKYRSALQAAYERYQKS